MTDIRQQIEDAWTSVEKQSAEQPTENNVAISEDNNTAPAEPAEVISAPNSYKQEFKDSFNTLTPEWQKYLAAREKEVEQGLSRARNQYSWVDKAYNDRKDILTQQGYNNAQEYFNDLTLIADALNKNPAETIKALQSGYGITNDGQTQDNALQRQVTALQQMVNNQQNYLEQQRQERTAQMYDAFINAKDDNGNTKHVYFDDVKNEMVTLLKTGLAKDYEDAYNQAIWRVEGVRNKLIAEQAKADLAAKAAEAQKVKTAAFEPSAKTEPTPKKRTLREELEHNMAIYGDE